MKTIVSPSDCAMAVGVPLTRDRFVQRFLAREEGSFIFESVLGGNLRERDPDAAWSRWSDKAGQIEKGLKRLERKGVKVQRDAVLDDLLVLMDRFEVVTVFSHWRSALFRASDLRDPEAVGAALCDSAHALHRAVRALTGAPPHGEERLAELNRALFSSAGDVPIQNDADSAPGRQSTLQTLWHERRLLLESCAPHLFRGGASVELADGFKTVETIVANVPPSFDRLLDLTVCTCVLMATRIKQRAPRCYVACNEHWTYPLPRLLIYQRVIDLLSATPGSFEDTVFKVRALIQSEVDRERNKKSAEPLSGQRAFR
ncbi:hypothetical protein [Paraburkholderia sp. GAS42]|jgi:hypothetical protein|uniref:hypothetical protein n=1 Tax=Paraburkholderia sp. GAS42 TaxID=3035135 RepID=UPI003D1D45AC